MSDPITWVGLDAHKSFIQVAVLQEDAGEVREWRVKHTAQQVRRLAKRLTRDFPGEVRCCYEAGPCGFGLKRMLEQAAPLVCEVVAPALIPVKPGDRIKTDRRDAQKLARYLRSDLLTEVHPPTETEEAVRDLCRCREAIVADRMRARHRLSKWLLRRAFHYHGNNWTQAHHGWLRGLSFDDTVDQAVFDEYLLAVERLDERERAVNDRIDRVAQSEVWKERVGWLRCFYGIDTVAAMTILSEVHDFRRFTSPRQLMSYLGVTPSEHSSVTASRGGITKTGNAHARRMLVQVAHHYRYKPRVSMAVCRRREGQPAGIVAIAEKAHERCHRIYMRMIFKGKHHNQAVTAVARELAGFIWSALHEQARADQPEA